jgi:hypothetical protein
MDQNPGMIEPVVRDKKLSVVVIPASSFATDVLKVQGLPQNWIVDSTGTIRAKAYTWNVANWEAAMSEAIERHKR